MRYADQTSEVNLRYRALDHRGAELLFSAAMKHPAFLLPFLLATVLGLFTIPGDFVFDDITIVETNERLDSLGGIPSLFVDNYWGDFAQGGIYRPLVLTSFAIERAVWGRDSAAGYHMTNAVLYGLCAFLLTLLAHRLGVPPAGAVMTGLLFAAHPIHVEAVAPLVGRSELGSCLFVLLAIWNATGNRHEWRIAAGTGGAVLAALFFKETGLAAVPVLLLLPFVQVTRRAIDDGASETPLRAWFEAGLRELRKHGRTGVAVASAVVIWAILRSVALDRAMDEVGILNNVLSERGLGGRFAGALEVSLRYHWMALFPWPLSADYSYPALVPAKSLFSPLPLLGLLSWVGLAVGILVGLRKLPRVALGLGIYVAALVPVSNLLLPIGTIFGERLLFLPSAGVCLVAGVALWWTQGRGPRARMVGLTLCWTVIAVGTAAFLVRVPDWRSEATLAEAMVEVQPQSAKGQGKHGWELFQSALQLPDGAERQALIELGRSHLERSIELCPEFGDSHLNLSILLDHLELYEEAHLAATTARQLEPWKLNPHSAVARSHLRLEQPAKAVAACERGLKTYPGNPRLLTLRGQGYFDQNQFALAAADFTAVLKANPGDVGIRLIQLRSLLQGGALAQAKKVLDEVISTPTTAPHYADLKPELPSFLNNRGLIAMRGEDHGAAIEDFSRALTLLPGFTKARGNRFQSYLALGRLEDARRDLTTLEQQVGAAAVKALRTRLEQAEQK